jgi:hypothetical protein
MTAKIDSLSYIVQERLNAENAGTGHLAWVLKAEGSFLPRYPPAVWILFCHSSTLPHRLLSGLTIRRYVHHTYCSQWKIEYQSVCRSLEGNLYSYIPVGLIGSNVFQLLKYSSCSSLSCDRSVASSKLSSPKSAILSFLLQLPVSSCFLKFIQQLLMSPSSSSCLANLSFSDVF